MTSPEGMPFNPESIDQELAALLQAEAEIDALTEANAKKQKDAEAYVDTIMQTYGIRIQEAERDLAMFDSLPEVIEMRHQVEQILGRLFADLQVRRFHDKHRHEVEEMRNLRSRIAATLNTKLEVFGATPSGARYTRFMSFKRDEGFDIFFAHKRFVDLEPYIQVFDVVIGGEPLLDTPNFDSWLESKRAEDQMRRIIIERSRECRLEIRNYILSKKYTYNEPMSSFVSAMVQLGHVDYQQAEALGLRDDMVQQMLSIVDAHFPERQSD